jgi:hypothetical protein
MARRGRKPVLDEGKKREIVAILSVGSSRRTAARYVGCAVATIRNTAARDPRFARDLQRAKAGIEIRYLGKIREAADKDKYWRAAAWALERLNPEDFVLRRPDVFTMSQVTHLLSQAAEIVVQEVPDPRRRKNILRRISALSAGLRRDTLEEEPGDDP